MFLHDTREKDDELCMNRTVSCMRIGRIDLIAADFLGGKMTGSPRQQVMAYVALFLGALSMSSLAVWA